MDDKTELAALMQRIASTLEAQEKAMEAHAKVMEAHTREISSCLQTMRDRAEAELKQRMAQLNAIAAAPKYIAGRWPRRDGDGLGTKAWLPNRNDDLTQPLTQPNGDGKTGDL